MKLLPQNSEGTVSGGIWFVCEDGPNNIKVWGSSFSGKEEVYLNDKLVSEKRSLTMNSEHAFTDAEGTEYMARITVISMMKGILECQLYRDGNLLKKYRSGYGFGQLFNFRYLAVLLVSAVLVGVLGAVLDLPEWGILILISLFGIVVFFLSLRRGRFTIAEVQV